MESSAESAANNRTTIEESPSSGALLSWGGALIPARPFPTHMALRVGVLAVQGAVSEHIEALLEAGRKLGVEVEAVAVRTPEELASVSGIVLPGGESTTISRLLRSGHLQEPLVTRAKHGDLAVFGTCAGLILLASTAKHDVEDRDIQLLGLLDAEVDRNAFGRQAESFEADVEVKGVGTIPAVFIRAPVLTELSEPTVALASSERGTLVAQKGRILGTAFHPELTGDTRMHELFLGLVQEAAAAAPEGKTETGAPAPDADEVTFTEDEPDGEASASRKKKAAAKKKASKKAHHPKKGQAVADEGAGDEGDAVG